MVGYQWGKRLSKLVVPGKGGGERSLGKSSNSSGQWQQCLQTVAVTATDNHPKYRRRRIDGKGDKITVDYSKFGPREEFQRMTQLLCEFACQVERDTAKVGVAQQIVQIVGKQFEYETKMSAKGEISSHPHFTRSHDIVVIGIGVTSVHLLLGCRRVLTVPSSVLRQGHRCCRCGDDRGYLWRLGLLHGRYRCEPGVIGCAIRGHNGCECAVIQNGRVEHGLIHIGHGRGFADHFIGRSIGRCPLNGASYLSLMLLILKMVVMVLEHFVGMGSEGRWWSHSRIC
ncbi:hypothetical protein X801_09893 [Opisthorchis viverrini]|uniref:Uncharacterized protein n=1 Tax=Opisthorchis viverrini TaxID=6198 RepID=A0A1S8WIP5_OPIVI|nr:hypothetical protein X801_09893 [Opisthorchis viverrini]